MNFKLYSILVAIALLMGACSSDDNNDDPKPAQEIVGSYKGYTVAEFKYSTIPMITTDETVVFTENEDGTSHISFKSNQWGTFTISKATTTLANDTYSVTGSGKTLMGMDEASLKEYDCTVAGTISKDKKTVSLVFNVPSVMGGLKITFNLGDAPANLLIAGTYNGTLDMVVSGNSVGQDATSTVTIKSLDNGKSQVTLKGFGVTGMQLENIVIDDVTVSTNDDGSHGLEGIIKTTSGTINVTGTLAGEITKAGKANIVFILNVGAMPMPITATFTSN